MKVLYIFLFVCSLGLSAQGQIPEKEQQALKDLYRFTNGLMWEKSWDISKDGNNWHGVSIKNNHVVGLALSGNKLNGELPSTLNNLEYLEYIDLSSNNLSGELPDIKHLERLKVLILTNNELSGTIPEALKGLKNLKRLELADNLFINTQDFKKLDVNRTKVSFTSNAE